ncbi:MAG: hypothetical protein WAQ48_04550 [Limnochordia bacterium]
MGRYATSIALTLLLLAGSAAHALDRANMSVSAIVPQMIHLELDAGELVFEHEDFDYIMGTAERTKTGVVATKKRALLATVSGNVPYTLLISAPEEYFFGQRGGLIHISQLRWRLPPDSDVEAWKEITLERRPVMSGPPGVAEVTFDFQLIATWENPAETYTGEILLTVVPDNP